MNHPDELLAPYVDGSLTEAERADVERHVRGCARCRREAALASGARAAIRAIPDAASPGDLAAAAIEAAARNARPPKLAAATPSRSDSRPRWLGWATAAAGVAAALIVASIVLPNIGAGRSGSAPEAAAPALRALAPATAVEVQDADYDTAAVQGLAAAYRPAGASPVPAAEQAGGGAATFGASAGSTTRLNAGGLGAAAACVSNAFGQPGGTLVRLIQARYQGTPAYIGVYLVGPGAGQPPNRVRVYIAARDDCSIITFTQASL